MSVLEPPPDNHELSTKKPVLVLESSSSTLLQNVTWFFKNALYIPPFRFATPFWFPQNPLQILHSWLHSLFAVSALSLDKQQCLETRVGAPPVLILLLNANILLELKSLVRIPIISFRTGHWMQVMLVKHSFSLEMTFADITAHCSPKINPCYHRRFTRLTFSISSYHWKVEDYTKRRVA